MGIILAPVSSFPLGFYHKKTGKSGLCAFYSCTGGTFSATTRTSLSNTKKATRLVQKNAILKLVNMQGENTNILHLEVMKAKKLFGHMTMAMAAPTASGAAALVLCTVRPLFP